MGAQPVSQVAQDLKKEAKHEFKQLQEADQSHLSYIYGNPLCVSTIPKVRLPQKGMGGTAFVRQMIQDELLLDGNPAQNLASFVTTWMEPEAEQLMLQGMRKNYIDFDEYPQTAEIQNRCVNMLASL